MPGSNWIEKCWLKHAVFGSSCSKRQLRFLIIAYQLVDEEHLQSEIGFDREKIKCFNYTIERIYFPTKPNLSRGRDGSHGSTCKGKRAELPKDEKSSEVLGFFITKREQESDPIAAINFFKVDEARIQNIY